MMAAVRRKSVTKLQEEAAAEERRKSLVEDAKTLATVMSASTEASTPSGSATPKLDAPPKQRKGRDVRGNRCVPGLIDPRALQEYYLHGADHVRSTPRCLQPRSPLHCRQQTDTTACPNPLLGSKRSRTSTGYPPRRACASLDAWLRARTDFVPRVRRNTISIWVWV